jgi:RNA polymerase sigma-70 factor (ECF subfamily)
MTLARAVFVAKPDRTSEFLALFTAHDRGLRKYILTLLGDSESTQEVFQETSATLWQKFDEFEPGSNFFAWACRIAYFEVLEFRRRRRRHRLTFNEGLLATLSSDLVEREGVLQARRMALPDCMERLPVVDRELVEQRYAGGETILEIAERTGRSVHALYKALGRIRRTLMKCIEDSVAETGQPPKSRLPPGGGKGL